MSSNGEASGIAQIISNVRSNYLNNTNRRIKLIDLLIFCLGIISVTQVAFVYVSGVSFPFNSYCSGMYSAVGSMVLSVALRMQLTNRKLFSNIKPEKAFADYLFAMAVLHIAVFNYLG
jgi:hypothetical protein